MTPAELYQDPEELFDLVRADGTPLGRTKARAAVHRDGDWHRAVHVWIYGIRETGPFMIFQRRGRFKDTAAGRLDPTVGGHYGAGETLAEALREVEEEIGIEADPAAMRFAGVRVRSSESEPEVIDRELQDVFLWERAASLELYAPNPAELEGLVEVLVAEILAIFSGAQQSAPARWLDASNLEIGTVVLGRDEFLPSVDRYVYRVAIAILAVLRGDAHVAV